jgi:hypothetical protein
MGATGYVRAGTWDGALDPDPARRPVQVAWADPCRRGGRHRQVVVSAALMAYLVPLTLPDMWVQWAPRGYAYSRRTDHGRRSRLHRHVDVDVRHSNIGCEDISLPRQLFGAPPRQDLYPYP